jgi:hypothetical protein
LEIGSHYVGQAGLGLKIPLPYLPITRIISVYHHAHSRRVPLEEWSPGLEKILWWHIWLCLFTRALVTRNYLAHHLSNMLFNHKTTLSVRPEANNRASTHQILLPFILSNWLEWGLQRLQCKQNQLPSKMWKIPSRHHRDENLLTWFIFLLVLRIKPKALGMLGKYQKVVFEGIFFYNCRKGIIKLNNNTYFKKSSVSHLHLR